MKILVFTTLYPNSVQTNHGIFVEKRLLELQKRFDVEARVLAPVPWYPKWLAKRRNLPDYHAVPRRETRHGIQIDHPRYPVIPGVSWRFAPILISIFSRATAARIKTEFPFELVDAHFAFPDGVAASRIAQALVTPCIVTARGSDINDSPNYLLPKFFLKRAFRRINCLVAVSQRLKTRLVTLGAKESEVVVLPNGVDTEEFRPLDNPDLSRFGIKQPYLLSVGNLRELKGHHLVIKALAENPNLQQISLVIAGEGGMRDSLETLIKELSLEDRVHLLGEVANQYLPDLYSAAEAFVLASSNEGCPNVVLEALACGVPVIASDVGAVPDLLPSNLHEFMIQDRQPAMIGKLISSCLDANLPKDEIQQHAKTLNWDATCRTLNRIMQQQLQLAAGATRL